MTPDTVGYMLFNPGSNAGVVLQTKNFTTIFSKEFPEEIERLGFTGGTFAIWSELRAVLFPVAEELGYILKDISLIDFVMSLMIQQPPIAPVVFWEPGDGKLLAEPVNVLYAWEKLLGEDGSPHFSKMPELTTEVERMLLPAIAKRLGYSLHVVRVPKDPAWN